MPKFGHKNSSTKYSFSNKPEPEISGPVEFEIHQWFTLKKWKNNPFQYGSKISVAVAGGSDNPVKSGAMMTFPKFCSLSDKLHMDLMLNWRRPEEGYTLFYCMARIS